jgi:hypothetical protein
MNNSISREEDVRVIKYLDDREGNLAGIPCAALLNVLKLINKAEPLPEETSDTLDAIEARLTRLQKKIESARDYRNVQWHNLILAAEDVAAICLQLIGDSFL